MHRRSLVVAAVALVATAAACDPLATPPGPPSLRYRDAIFSSITKTADVPYGTAVDQANQPVTLKLDVYRPTGDTVRRRPAIVWVHGGAFFQGDKSSPELVDEANQFASMGYVNVSINYRLSPTSCRAAATAACAVGVLQAREDAQTAVRFLRAESACYGVDPARIAIGGSSAGAITALNVGYQSENAGAGDHQGFSSAVARCSHSRARCSPPLRSVPATRRPCSSTALPILSFRTRWLRRR